MVEDEDLVADIGEEQEKLQEEVKKGEAKSRRK